ncbi:MAG: hypothetical protein M1473_05755, partial [Firmicutes bacterium]|nr:hypothetical protein [Bacillota bacterium]
EPGQVWMERLLRQYPKAVWINPQPQERWRYYPSIRMMADLMDQRMYPFSLEGLSQAIDRLL